MYMSSPINPGWFGRCGALKFVVADASRHREDSRTSEHRRVRVRRRRCRLCTKKHTHQMTLSGWRAMEVTKRRRHMLSLSSWLARCTPQTHRLFCYNILTARSEFGDIGFSV